jgi:murein DD-endopeptidase MepM/ murein hydrolase activator NlpD
VGTLLLVVSACSPATAPPTSTAVSPSSTTTSAPPRTTTTTIDTREGEPACLERARFGEPTESPYLLPFPPGTQYKVTQTYCVPGGGHRNQLAYDFNLPIGADVLAARSGLVINIREDSPDDGQGQGEHNFIFIQHDDGTVAFYAHLQLNGVLVDVGDEVEAGQLIALSGNSGLTGRPHLHFGVYQSAALQEGYDVPVNFRNTSYPLDDWGGLRQGGVYLAEKDPGLPS